MTEDEAEVRWWEWANDMERRLHLIALLSKNIIEVRAEWTQHQAQVVLRVAYVGMTGASPWGMNELIYALPKWELARLDWEDLQRALEETVMRV